MKKIYNTDLSKEKIRNTCLTNTWAEIRRVLADRVLVRRVEILNFVFQRANLASLSPSDDVALRRVLRYVAVGRPGLFFPTRRPPAARPPRPPEASSLILAHRSLPDPASYIARERLKRCTYICKCGSLFACPLLLHSAALLCSLRMYLQLATCSDLSIVDTGDASNVRTVS